MNTVIRGTVMSLRARVVAVVITIAALAALALVAGADYYG